MTAVLGCIADDFTGGTDLAETLSRNGMRTIQLLGVPDPAIGLKEPSQGASPHLPDSRSLPAVFMAPYLPWRRASTKRRSTNAL